MPPTARAAAKKAAQAAPDPELGKKLDQAFGPVNPPADQVVAPANDGKASGELTAEDVAGIADSQAVVKPFWLGAPRASLTSSPKWIFPAMHAAMQEIRAVGKTGYNEQQKYPFRGIDGVVNAAGPAFRNHGIIPAPELLSVKYRDTKTTQGKDTREVVVEVDYHFYALDGSSITVRVPGESLDTSDKGTAKAMSVAYRIALIQLLAIPTHEPDPDASYLTREGTGPMVESLVDWMRRMVTGNQAVVTELADLWKIVQDHSAGDRTVPGDEQGHTWFELFANRWSYEIAATKTFADGRALKQVATKANVLGWRVGDTTLDGLLTRRYDEMVKTHQETHEKILGMIAAASIPDQCDLVDAEITSAFEEYRLQRSSKLDNEAELRAVLDDRRVKLAEEIEAAKVALEAAPSVATTAHGGGPVTPAAMPPAEPVQRQAGDLDPDNPDHYTTTGFPKLSNNPARLQIRDLAEGILAGAASEAAERIAWLMTQCEAVDQLVTVRDTIAKAFGRDKKITEAEHRHLLAELRGYCEQHGVVGLVTE